MADDHKAWLVGETGAAKGKRYPIGESCKIGRIPGQNQVVLDDSEVSRFHATIQGSSTGEFRLQDSSANGTYVNGHRVQTALLRPGDHIRFGLNQANTFAFEAEAPPQKEAEISHGTVLAQAVAARRKQTVVAPAEELPAQTCRFQLVLDKYAVQDIPLENDCLILGRTPGEGVFAIDHSSVSEKHAEVTLDSDGRATLRDLKSLNGTFVNGERITSKVLEEGDLVQLGACESYLLLFRDSRPRTLKLSEIELNQPVIKLGRNPSNTIHLEHPTVSAFHAEIHKSNGTFELIDLDSSNGTFVNGVRITRKVLQTRDHISLGAMQFVFNGQQFEQAADGTRIRLIAQQLRAEVSDSQTGRTLRLLDDISLILDPCEFVGLLGPSGAGKSTLMDALNGFRPAGQGKVLLNDRNLYEYLAVLRSLIGYLPQDDILHRGLTVRECLFYSAKLRLPDDYSDKEIRVRVNDVMRSLDLSERAENCIYQLSGGQRKRVSLGIELLSKPSILFVDEPTAGQDPRTEAKLMELFREIANKGATVVINTHLLGSFSLLDKVAVLVRGKLAFFGPSQEMLPYFKAQRPHEVFDRLHEQPPDHWANAYRDSSLCRQYITDPIGQETQQITAKASAAPAKEVKVRHSAIRQFFTLLSRQFTLKIKDKGNVAALLVPPALIAILMGFMKHGPNEPKSLFMMVLVALWFGCSATVREIVDETAIYKRERQRELKISSYLASKLAYLAVVTGLQTGLFVGVMTIMDTQENHFLASWGITWLLGFQGGLIGLLISAIASSAEKALYAFPLTMIPQLLLAGLLIPVTVLHPFYVSTATNPPRIVDFPGELQQRAMSPAFRDGLSPLMIARWGLESLSDLYIHDGEPYSYALLNSVSITFHPDDPVTMRTTLQKRMIPGDESPPNSSPALPEYLGVMGIFALVMCVAIAIALVRKEKASHAG
ncbi:MAG TPA: FHA domain-containing protein [Candidatus Angelobacter sp.]